MATSINLAKISTIPLNAGSLEPTGPVHIPSANDLPPLLLTCASQFTFAATQTNPASAKITMVPHDDSKFSTTSLKETAVSFKPLDATAKALAAKWNAPVPKDAVAYATFTGPVIFFSELDALLFVTKGAAHPLYLADQSLAHVWQSTPKMAYCRKSKLFVLQAEGYSMMVDFGI